MDKTWGWTCGLGHGVGHGLPYGLPVVRPSYLFLTRTSKPKRINLLFMVVNISLFISDTFGLQ